MFILGAENAEIRVLRLGSLQLRFRLRDRFIVAEPGLIQIARKIQRLLIRAHRGIEQPLQRILRAKLIIIGGEFGLRGQAHILQIGGAGLRRERVGFHGVSNAAPQIRLPGSFERQREAWCS